MACFNPGCQTCPRLVSYLNSVQSEIGDYHCAPVEAFGDEHPSLLIIGLAPGKHGANKTGRPFTGDSSGTLLYQTLFDLGFASANCSQDSDDGLLLSGVRITNAVKCLPPENRPTTKEIHNCLPYLNREIELLPASCNLLALGKLAHDAVLRSYNLKLSSLKFSHAACHELPDGRKLFDSYHCSRYNTQTKRLTPEMFNDIILQATAS